MTATHHPADELLLAHASGASDEALSLIVGTHLALCPECRAKVAHMESLGGAILSDLPPAAISDSALNSVMSRLDAAPVETRAPRAVPARYAAPEPLRSYLNGDLDRVRWTMVGPGISYKPLFKAGAGRAQLIRSRPGRGVGTHSHGGEELTLVLTGGFTDVTGHYRRGDLQTADDSILHRPLADPGEDCIVLAVSNAPLRFSNAAVGLLGKLFGF
ncbi:MAG TPA: ChrR family anti-sigma-E factor [Rhizomicrobium sp.]|jgi:putative transcriptional regulator|nr:ChrR family anti-sigma-E factor [Rhizomicrobium sp.]